MKIIELNNSTPLDTKAQTKYNQLKTLLDELRSRDIPGNIVSTINSNIEALNFITDINDLKRQVKQSTNKIAKLVEKELNLVPKNHYRNTWLAVGMSAFGIPIGVAFGTALKNLGLIGIGLPIGMALGVGVGIRLDKKALDEGRQLNVEI